MYILNLQLLSSFVLRSVLACTRECAWSMSTGPLPTLWPQWGAGMICCAVEAVEALHGLHPTTSAEAVMLLHQLAL